jgi:hypothetical protein
MSWAGILVSTLILKYHISGFEACLTCYYIDADTDNQFSNKAFELPLMQKMEGTQINKYFLLEEKLKEEIRSHRHLRLSMETQTKEVTGFGVGEVGRSRD